MKVILLDDVEEWLRQARAAANARLPQTESGAESVLHVIAAETVLSDLASIAVELPE